MQLKDWICVELTHHEKIADTIAEFQKNGWSLHTYQVAGKYPNIRHYLLVEKGD